MSERGHAAVELALAVGVLLLPAALAVLAFGPWSEKQVAAEALAAEAARTAVLELSLAAGASAVGEQAAALGLDPTSVRLGWCGASPENQPAGSCALARGSAVSATIEIWTPLVPTPWGPVGGLWVSADHSEPIDLYRSLG
ncbi:MAG: hypothetical protein PVF87_06405 [Acidimicrobiia bacterium]